MAWPSGQSSTRLVIQSIQRPRVSSPALTASWICSQVSRVQILGYACKQPTGCLLPVGILNLVIFHLNLFVSFSLKSPMGKRIMKYFLIQRSPQEGNNISHTDFQNQVSKKTWITSTLCKSLMTKGQGQCQKD